MTNKYNSFLVVLEEDIREDDAEMLIKAIEMLKGVLSVKGNISNMESRIAESRVKCDLRDKLFKILE